MNEREISSTTSVEGSGQVEVQEGIGVDTCHLDYATSEVLIAIRVQLS